jgi:hypothetical protein
VEVILVFTVNKIVCFFFQVLCLCDIRRLSALQDAKKEYQQSIHDWTQAGTHLSPVTDQERDAVEKVFLDTFIDELTGLGMDARGLGQHVVKVILWLNNYFLFVYFKNARCTS